MSSDPAVEQYSGTCYPRHAYQVGQDDWCASITPNTSARENRFLQQCASHNAYLSCNVWRTSVKGLESQLCAEHIALMCSEEQGHPCMDKMQSICLIENKVCLKRCLVVRSGCGGQAHILVWDAFAFVLTCTKECCNDH